MCPEKHFETSLEYSTTDMNHLRTQLRRERKHVDIGRNREQDTSTRKLCFAHAQPQSNAQGLSRCMCIKMCMIKILIRHICY